MTEIHILFYVMNLVEIAQPIEERNSLGDAFLRGCFFSLFFQKVKRFHNYSLFSQRRQVIMERSLCCLVKYYKLIFLISELDSSCEDILHMLSFILFAFKKYWLNVHEHYKFIFGLLKSNLANFDTNTNLLCTCKLLET